MSRLGRVFFGFLLLTGACVSSEVTVTGAKHASRVSGCDIKIFPSTTPDYKWEDIATVKARCHSVVGRNGCIDELKNRTCDLGGDTLYGLKDGEDQNSSIVIGTVAVRSDPSASTPKAREVAKTGGEPPKPSSEPAAPPVSASSPASSSCDPPCSPGYRCTDGQCLALCNPPCGEGMRCNQQRMCEAAPGQ
jgi:hypothetical protein